MNKTYEVTFGAKALPGVAAIGNIRRGQTVAVPAAEAVRLVDVKGLAFASTADETAARAELAGRAAAPPPPLPATDTQAAAAPAPAASPEH